MNQFLKLWEQSESRSLQQKALTFFSSISRHNGTVPQVQLFVPPVVAPAGIPVETHNGNPDCLQMLDVQETSILHGKLVSACI